MFELLRQDAARYVVPSIGGYIRLLLLSPGFQLSVSIRLMAVLGRIPWVGRGLRRVLWYLTKIYHSCDIDVAATFGGGLYLPHTLGIVVGGEWDVGRNVTILQQVTLGRNEDPTTRSSIGEGAHLGAGSKIIGSLKIGSNVRVGANAVVLTDLPDGVTAVGVPARIIPR